MPFTPVTPNGVKGRLWNGLRSAVLDVTGLPAAHVFYAPDVRTAFSLGKEKRGAGLVIALFSPVPSIAREFGSGAGKGGGYFFALPVFLLGRAYGGDRLTPGGELADTWEQLVASGTGVTAWYRSGGDRPSIGDGVIGEIPIYHVTPDQEIRAPDSDPHGGQSGLLMTFKTAAEVRL